jgi:tRNA threonylcarbamoyladenosine biosynthesis protein TsaE
VATFTSNSPAETEAAARKFAADLKGGDIVALQGDLGAGKTCFSRGLVAGLESRVVVTSPTFTLLHEYSGGRAPIYHFDFFRLQSEAEASALALDDYFFSSGVCIVEWADRFPRLIPSTAKWVKIESRGAESRLIVFP